jgi:hypothetical protein
VAAIGGALVLGALPRIKRSLRVGDALLMGLGATILANSRPYEGMIFILPVAVALAMWMVRRSRPPLRLVARRVLAPLGIVLSLTALAMGYYFWRVTGRPFRWTLALTQWCLTLCGNLLCQYRFIATRRCTISICTMSCIFTNYRVVPWACWPSSW